MKQSELGLNLTTKRTRKREFLDEMSRVMPWAELVALVVPYAPEDKKGRPPFAVSTMVRIHFMQQWFGLSDQGNQWYFGMTAHIGADAESGLVHTVRGTAAAPDVEWHVTMRPGKRRALDMSKPLDALIDEAERIKASIRAKLKHPFRVVKLQFGFVKLRYRGLMKNTAQLTTLFALSNLWVARGKLMGVGA